MAEGPAPGRAPVQDTEALARTALAAVDRHDLDALHDLWHPDLEEWFVATGRRLDRPGTAEEFRGIFAAFPDFSIAVEAVHVDGGTATVQWHATGTHTGAPFNGIERTDRPIALDGIDVMEFSDGLLRRNTVYYDGLAVARALGALPPEGSLAERAMLALLNLSNRARRAIARR